MRDPGFDLRRTPLLRRSFQIDSPSSKVSRLDLKGSALTVQSFTSAGSRPVMSMSCRTNVPITSKRSATGSAAPSSGLECIEHQERDEEHEAGDSSQREQRCSPRALQEADDRQRNCPTQQQPDRERTRERREEADSESDHRPPQQRPSRQLNRTDAPRDGMRDSDERGSR